MKLNYELTEQDYLDFNIYHSKHSPTIKKSILLQRALGPVVFLIAPFLAIRITNIPLWYWLAIFFISSIIWFVFYPKYFNWELSRRVSKLLNEGKNLDMVGSRSINLTQDGLIESTPHSESKVGWDMVEMINETEDYIYIYISAVSAYIVPIRVFKDAKEKETFRNTLDMYINN